MKKTKIGSDGVDSGQLMITDPCYVKEFDLHNDFEDIRRYKNKKSGKVLQYKKDFSNYEEIIPEYKKTMNELNYKESDIYFITKTNVFDKYM